MSKRVFLLASILIAVLSANLQAQNGCFSAITNYSVEFVPQAIISADFNGDGNMDLVTASGGTNYVSVLLGMGTGSFNPAVPYLAGNGLSALTSADFDGDGKLDLATVNGSGYQILFGTGTGSFAPPTGSGTAYGPEDIVAGDFNGDGKPDLAIVNTIQGKNVGVLINNGNGTFAPEVTYSALGAHRIVTADFNGDGKLDLAVGRNGSASQSDISVFYGAGTGVFGTAVNYYPAGFYVSGIASADFNGDGKADVAITSANSTSVAVSLAGPTGSFATGTSYNVGTGPRAVFPADFNNDGKIDLAVSNYSSTNVSILLNTGNGNFGAATNYSIGASPTDITAADFDGDGKADFAVSVDYYTAAVLLNTAPGVSLTASTTSFCAGGTATLNASGADTYTWSGGPNTNSYVVTPGATTVYSVSGSNSLGCISNTATLTITVKPLPTLTFSNNAFICAGDSSAISASGASTYTWSTGAQTPSVSFIASTTSSFSVTGTNTLTGCTASAAVQLSVSECTGVTDLKPAHLQVSVFPNPAIDKVELKIENAGQTDSTIEIFNALGKIVKTHIFSPENRVIDISSLGSGIYFLRIHDHVQKFVKE